LFYFIFLNPHGSALKHSVNSGRTVTTLCATAASPSNSSL